jgi:ferric-dicitrate binding protein FerR (iron transport regulator)
MKPALHTAYSAELRLADEAEAQAEHSAAWRHLERAHVLSQAHAMAHVVAHAHMLVHAWRQRDAREVLGQLVRIALAAPASWLGRAPLGNTGGADVGLLTPMPVPEDLRAMLDD